MNLRANSARRRLSRSAPQAHLAVARKSLSRHRTARIERFFLLAIVIVLSLDRSFIAGFSVGSALFMVYGGYVLLKRPGPLARILSDPVFVIAYILLALSVAIESFHPHADYSEIFRIGQMFAGGIIIASLCRDRQALRAAMLGYLITGVGVSVYLFLTSFSALGGATATDFVEASLVRHEVYKDTASVGSPIILVGGVVVALASTLIAHAPRRRYLFLAIAAFCSITSFMTLSRTTMVMLIASSAAITLASGIWRGRTIFIAGVVGAAIVMWVPDVVWSRFTLQTDAQRGHHEARVRLYIAAAENFPEYAMTGVGAGNFREAWARQTSFDVGTRNVVGAHNSFVQVTIFWGLAVLLTLLAVVWQAYRCLPRHCGGDVLSLQLLGVSVAALILSLTIHNLYAKDFSLVLGLLVGARCWIWPQASVQPVTWKQRLLRRTLHASTRNAHIRSKISR